MLAVLTFPSAKLSLLPLPPPSSFSSSSLLPLLPLCHSLHLPVRSKTKRTSSSYSSIRCSAQLSLSELAPAASAAYGTLLLGGGLFAYVRSGSKGSILGGASGAVLMATACYLMQSPGTKVAGDAIAFGSAFLFSAVFGIRLAATRKPVPAGPLLAVSAGSMFVFVSAYLHDKI